MAPASLPPLPNPAGRCATCGRLGTDGWVEACPADGPRTVWEYCRHCWAPAYAGHRAAFRAAFMAPDPPPDPRATHVTGEPHGWRPALWPQLTRGKSASLSAHARWIAGTSPLARWARRLFP